MSAWNRRANEVFLAALALPEAERSAYVAAACNGDSALRRETDELLAAAASSNDFLERPAACLPPLSSRDVFGDGDALAGKYRLRARIGAGGMGTVFRAEQLEPVRREVAVKLLRAADSPSLLLRFEQERQALALMNHPSVAKVLDAGVESGRPFLVMELIEGAPIVRCADEARLAIRERLELFIQVCHGLQHAHQKGIIHRDLKPSNILVATEGGARVPKIIDFGVAKVAGPRLIERTLATEPGLLVGTLDYMSPEQAGAAGRDVDVRSDVFSLGVILYELLAGARPFSGGGPDERLSIEEKLRRLRSDDPPPLASRLTAGDELLAAAARRADPRSLRAALAGDLDWIVQRCLEKDPDKRYPAALDLARDLRRHLDHEPVEARPAGATYRLRKFLRRRRGAALAAALVFVALVAGVVGIATGYFRSERARVAEAAERARAEAAVERARDALDAMTSATVGDVLTAQPALAPEQRRLLDSALRYYSELAAADAQTLRARFRNARAANRVGMIEHRLGRFDAADNAFRAAAETYAGIAAEINARSAVDPPLLSEVEDGLAFVLGNRALSLEKLGDLRGAIAQAESAIPIRRKQAESRAGGPEATLALAEDEFSLGRLLVAARDRERGEASLRAALDAVAGMAKSEKSLGLAARIRTSLVSLCVAREDLESAVLHARAAVDAREELLKTAPKSAASRRSLALEQGNLASILGNLGRVEEAASLYRSCLASLESLANENPSAPEFRHAAATFGLNFARFLGARGRQKEEFERTERSVEILARLRADFPAAIDYAIDLGGARSNQSQTFRRRGDPGRALESLNAAVSDLDAALKIQPDHARARRYLKTACVARALAHESSADHKAARADWLRAVELSQPDAAPDFRSAAALALARSGDPEAALREVADLAGSPEPAPLACRDLAALLVLAAEKAPPAAKNERLDRAAAFVRRLLKAGISREQVLQHPELAPLLKQIDRKSDL